MEKLEWLGYQTVKNIEDIFIRFGATHERDGRTDGQTPGDDARLSIGGKNYAHFTTPWFHQFLRFTYRVLQKM